MTQNYFPSSLNVAHRDCLVIGDDHEAVEKAERLQKAGAIVTKLPLSQFNVDQLQNQFLVIFCPKDQPVLAKHVFEICRQKKILLCAIDQPQYCDIVNVSVYERGDLKIMISTNGVAPAFGKKIRQGLEKSLQHLPVEEFMLHLATMRKKMEQSEPDVSLRRKKLIAAVESVVFEAKMVLPDFHQS